MEFFIMFKVVAVATFDPIQYGLKPHVHLFRYQVTGIQKMIEGMSVLCDEMGLGKTIQTIGALHHLDMPGSNSDRNPNLVVVPTPALAQQWKKELIDKSVAFSEDRIVIVTNEDEWTSLQDQLLKEVDFLREKVVITTYDIIKKNNSQKRLSRVHKKEGKQSVEEGSIQQSVEMDSGGEEKGRKRLADLEGDQTNEAKRRKKDEFSKDPGWFGRQAWNVMVCDEIHKMGSVMSYNFDGLRPSEDPEEISSEDSEEISSENPQVISKGINAVRRIALSGTPVVRTMHEIVATLAVTDPAFNWKELKSQLKSVADGMGKVLGYLVAEWSPIIGTPYDSGEDILKQVFKGNKDSLKKMVESIKEVVSLVHQRYILRNFEGVRQDFLESKETMFKRNYLVRYSTIEVEKSPELTEAITKSNENFQHEWYTLQGTSTMFHVSGKRVRSSLSDTPAKTNGRRPPGIVQVYSTSSKTLFKHKISALLKKMESINEPIVIAVDRCDEIEKISKILEEKQYTVYVAKTLEEYRTHCKSDAPTDCSVVKTPVLVMKPPVLVILQSSTGLNITEAKHMFIFDQPKSQAELDQVMARIHRIGQTSDIHFYHFNPVTDVDIFYEDICRLQRESMSILVNPKSFLQRFDNDDSDGDRGDHSVRIATFFVAKAIHELIQRCIKPSKDPKRDIMSRNLQLLKGLEFKVVFTQFMLAYTTTMQVDGDGDGDGADDDFLAILADLQNPVQDDGRYEYNFLMDWNLFE